MKSIAIRNFLLLISEEIRRGLAAEDSRVNLNSLVRNDLTIEVRLEILGFLDSILPSEGRKIKEFSFEQEDNIAVFYNEVIPFIESLSNLATDSHQAGAAPASDPEIPLGLFLIPKLKDR